VGGEVYSALGNMRGLVQKGKKRSADVPLTILGRRGGTKEDKENKKSSTTPEKERVGR